MFNMCFMCDWINIYFGYDICYFININRNIIKNEITGQTIWCSIFALGVVEILINMVSIILQFSHFENIYYKYCKCCDRCVKSCFASSLNKIVTTVNKQTIVVAPDGKTNDVNSTMYMANRIRTLSVADQSNQVSEQE